MPQDFPLKLSVLWLGPADRFTATECVFSLPFLPSVLLRFSRSFLTGSQLNMYPPSPGCPTSEDPNTVPSS